MPRPGKAESEGTAGVVVKESRRESPFLSVREVAEYLKINTKKVYALVGEGKIPATKVTGKWLFPKKLVDHWVMESSHGGLLTDRLVIAGSDDSLIQSAITRLVNELQGHALISYTHTNTELGLSLLSRSRADVAGVRWGPSSESDRRHAALIQTYPPHSNWVLIRVFDREVGLILSPDLGMPEKNARLFDHRVRWVMRHRELGAHSHFSGLLSRTGVNPAQIHVVSKTNSQHEAASLLARDQADATPGTRSCATQFGLDFISLGWEAYDFALDRGIYFRRLFQKLMEHIQDPECQRIAGSLGGYDFKRCGQIIWSD